MTQRKATSSNKPEHCGFVLGQKVFEKISAVEGIHLTEEMRHDLKQLTEKHLGTEAERQFLIKKYGLQPNT